MSFKNGAEKRKLNSNVMLVSIIFVVFSLIIGTVFICNFYSDKKTKVNYIGDAQYDLSSIKFDSNESTYLTGEWEFYYGKFLTTDNAKTIGAPVKISVPSSWSGIIKTDDYQSGGYATYKCYIKNVDAKNYLTIYIPNIACAYIIYINGVPITTSGSPNKKYSETFTSASHYSLPFTLEKDEVYEITVEISADNYSGIYMPVYMANYEHDNSLLNSKIAFRFILCGIVFFCGLMFIIFKNLINKDLYSLWLPVLAFVLLLRMMITTESYTVTQPLLFNIGFEEMNVFIFISTFIIKLIALVYIVKSMRIKADENAFVGFSAAFLALAIVINFLPNSIFDTYYYVILQLLSSIIDIYIVNKLCVEITKKTPYAFLYLISYLFIIFGVAIDTIYTNGMIRMNCSSVMPVCFFAFATITLIIHALRINKMYFYALKTQSLETELERANTSIMLSQIQPHFLYNALNTIKSLVKRDPAKAEKAIIDFSLYLRGNMDSLTKKDPIPFKEELDHVKYYCNIEQLRFQDKLDVFFEIGPDDFYVPTLSVQPIVENAIKHGVTKKPEGGTVTVSTYEDEENYYIEVEDDGIGFDLDQAILKYDGKRSHVGLTNIKERFETVMDANVRILSEIGKGTRVTVKLPKDKNVKTLKESLEYQDKKDIFKEMNI